ncbi:hypothetical protein FH972_017720 [Carpinus fangiana]|uniref:Choline transporter-like protein n=1 Tax=Carpinus fangiana TaxID=176857 RepID=A0A5N6RN71_9ROSI|nr:hypothetical protein FH972_017720 [Carpinus fangiana]
MQGVHHIQTQPPTNPIKLREARIPIRPTVVVGEFFRWSVRIVFFLHLILVTILIIFLTIRGLLNTSNNHHFHPEKWFPPLLTSAACAGIVGFTWQGITSCNPSKAIKAAFWLSPLLTCAVGILFFLIGSAGGIAAGAVAVISALIQSLYGCWVNPRFEYATTVLSVSTASPPAKTTFIVILSILASILYSCLSISGIGGATASTTSLDPLFISIILLSLAWTMHVIKNTVLVTIARVKYMHFACGAYFDTRVASTTRSDTGSARAMKLLAGDTDEFLFSCADCYSGIASAGVAYGNRWGFVHVGAYNQGFMQASIDTWEMFRMAGLETLINSDLTGAFCFLSGVAGGAICSLLSGIWALAIQESHPTQVSIYAFLIGYFMCRIAMAWPQACLLAYYVAYAENPQSPQFDSTIPVRIQELQRHQAWREQS